jgi:hypothetical protein
MKPGIMESWNIGVLIWRETPTRIFKNPLSSSGEDTYISFPAQKKSMGSTICYGPCVFQVPKTYGLKIK